MKEIREMRGITTALLTVIIGICTVAHAGNPPAAPKMDIPFYVYSDKGIAEAGYDFVPSGWMGNVDALEYNDCADNPYQGDCCIEVTFDDGKGWGGIVWQNPSGNWGDEEGGLDLTGATQLSFWAKGKNGGEQVEFGMGIIKDNKKFYDTANIDLGRVRLKKFWKKYVMDLKNKDLSRIVTGFSFSVKGKSKPVTFYLDEIIFE